MNFTIFITTLLILYGGYYLVIILSELLSRRKAVAVDAQFDFVFPVPAAAPQKVGKPAEPVKQSTATREESSTDEDPDWREEKEGEDLQGDLGLETITEGTGIEVSEENVQKILEQAT
ncbi:MAG: hypothetical protein J7497_10570 [Chitinophagaceae bacterium]|nr:hypothetical protein [Chitinophagaceae bacterium]